MKLSIDTHDDQEIMIEVIKDHAAPWVVQILGKLDPRFRGVRPTTSSSKLVEKPGMRRRNAPS